MRRLFFSASRMCAACVLVSCCFAFASMRSKDVNQLVLVVYNSRENKSKEVAQHYAQVRNIPQSNLCKIRTSLAEGTEDGTSVVLWNDFDDSIRKPIQNCLLKVGKEKILYIVLTYKMPFRIGHAPAGVGVAVDSYLSDIWNQLSLNSRVENPYFSRANPKLVHYPDFVSLAAYRASSAGSLLYSVWRLDASTSELAQGLVDKAMEAEEKGVSGQACFDRRYENVTKLKDTGYTSGDWDLLRSAAFVRAAGIPVIEDTHAEEFGTTPAPMRCDNAILYSGWYSTRYNNAFSWNVGAIGFHLDSSSATNPRRGENWSANAINHGITVTAGSVDEPYLQGLPHPAGVFHDLLQGANVGDAFLRNTAWLKWMVIYVGDPLYTPFSKAPLKRRE